MRPIRHGYILRLSSFASLRVVMPRGKPGVSPGLSRNGNAGRPRSPNTSRRQGLESSRQRFLASGGRDVFCGSRLQSPSRVVRHTTDHEGDAWNPLASTLTAPPILLFGTERTRPLRATARCARAFTGAVLTALGALPNVTSAQQRSAAERLEEIIVTSSIIGSSAATNGHGRFRRSSTTDIELRGYTDLADVLRTQPGIGVSNSGGTGKRRHCASVARKVTERYS